MSSADPQLDALLAAADELYAAPAAQFTADRDAAAKAAGDKELGRRIKALRKPSTAAWAVNLLVRREAEQIGQVLDLASSLRAAAEAMDGDELRALTRQRRQLTSALTSTARALAREHDVRLTGPVADQVEGVLNAAMLDPVAADAVRTGLLVTSFAGTGVSDLDVAAVLAVPEALGSTATPTEAPQAEPPGLHVVPETDEVRRARAQDAVDRAAAALEAAEAEASAADRAVAEWGARSLQVQDEIDELRRRLEELEAEADRIDGEAEEAGEVQQDAADALAQARREHEAAVRALGKLS